MKQLPCWEEVVDPHLDPKVAPDVLFLAAGLIVLDALASVQKYKNRELLFRASLARDRTQLLELTRAY